jgi:hypothetical protein
MILLLKMTRKVVKPLKERQCFKLILSEPLVINLHKLPKMSKLKVVRKKRTYQKSISIPVTIGHVLPYKSFTVVYTDQQTSADCSIHPLLDNVDAFNLGLFFNLQELVDDPILNVPNI